LRKIQKAYALCWRKIGHTNQGRVANQPENRYNKTAWQYHTTDNWPTTKRATIHLRQKRTPKFSHPQNSHDNMTWALAFGVSRSIQVPSSGEGAVMLPHADKAKPLSSTPF
jgi:hypothetical protein